MFRRLSARSTRVVALALGAALALPVAPAVAAAASPHRDLRFTSTSTTSSVAPDAAAPTAAPDAAVAPSLSVDPARLTQQEFVATPIAMVGEGLTPGAAVLLQLTEPSGLVQDIPTTPGTADEDGQWLSFLAVSGTPAAGTYGLKVSTGAVVVTTTFEVIVGDSVPSTLTATITPSPVDLADFLSDGVQLHATGLQPGERVTATVTYPEGTSEALLDEHADGSGVLDHTYVGGVALIPGHYTVHLHAPYSRDLEVGFDVVEGEDPPPTTPVTLEVPDPTTDLLLWSREGLYFDVGGLTLGEVAPTTLTGPGGTVEELGLEPADSAGRTTYGIGGSRDRATGTYTITVTSPTHGTATATFTVDPVPQLPPGDPVITLSPTSQRVDEFLEDGQVSIDVTGWAMYEEVDIVVHRPEGTTDDAGFWYADRDGSMHAFVDRYVVRRPVAGVYTVELTGEFTGVRTAQFTLSEVPDEDQSTLTLSVTSTTPQDWAATGITAVVRNFEGDDGATFSLQEPGADTWREMGAVPTDEDGRAELTLSITPEEAATLPLGTWSVKAFDDVLAHNVTTTFEVVAGGDDPGTPAVEPAVLALTAPPVHAGEPVVVTATVGTASGLVPTGLVRVTESGTVRGQAALAGGRAVLRIGALGVGTHALVVAYGGSSAVAAGSATVAVRVLPAPRTATSLVATVLTRHPVLGRAVAVRAVVRAAGGAAVSGKVVLSDHGRRIGTGTLRHGRVTVRVPARALGAGRSTVVVRFVGGDVLKASSDTVRIRVARAR